MESPRRVIPVGLKVEATTTSLNDNVRVLEFMSRVKPVRLAGRTSLMTLAACSLADATTPFALKSLIASVWKEM